MYKARASRRPRQSAALASPACSWPPPPRAPGRQALGRALVCWPWAEPTVFALRFQFSFSVFALNAESSCLLSKLLCLLPSFVLDIVSAGVMETHVFHCNDFWGFCWGGAVRGAQSRLLRRDLCKQPHPVRPRTAGRRWVSAELFRVARWRSHQLGVRRGN